jgi:hypothetical protein
MTCSGALPLAAAERPARAACRGTDGGQPAVPHWIEYVFYREVMPPEPLYCPPVVGMAGGMIGHLLCWDRHERDGSWRAWVSWIQQTSSRAVHKIVCVPGGSLTQLEAPDAYRDVPRRIFGLDGQIRPWRAAPGTTRNGARR